ncbi:hypothetical protein [Flagellimonas onchidii]|uniref:hypothetical protein n=1 Tax=Flagellimonas onchidii TaxID=2562684 RepID=UPI0010A5BEDB|nr:hypothetical protein [Allomuricauda onchidii]
MKNVFILIICLTVVYCLSSFKDESLKTINNFQNTIVEMKTISMGNGLINVFAKSKNGEIWNKWWDGKKWNGWQSLGGIKPLNKHLSVVSWGANRIDLFVLGRTGSVHHKYWNGSQWSNNWKNLGGEIPYSSNISAVSWGENRIDLFVKGKDKSVYQKSWNGNQWSKDWTNLGGQIPESSQISSVSWGENRIDLFVKGTDKSVYHKYWNGSQWSKGWINLGGQLPESSQISSVSWGKNRIDLFVKGADKSVYHKYWNGSQWSKGWISLGGQLPESSQISSVSWGENRIDLFVKGTDKSVYHKYWNGSQWSKGWINLGGQLPESSQISSVSWGTNRIDLFVKGMDKSVYHKWLSDNQWNKGWANLLQTNLPIPKVDGSIEIFKPENFGEGCITTAEGHLKGNNRNIGSSSEGKVSMKFELVNNSIRATANVKIWPDIDFVSATWSKIIFKGGDKEIKGFDIISHPSIQPNFQSKHIQIDEFTLPKGGADFFDCHKGTIKEVKTRYGLIKMVGDTGGTDITTNYDCSCDAKLVDIIFNKMVVKYNNSQNEICTHFGNDTLKPTYEFTIYNTDGFEFTFTEKDAVNPNDFEVMLKPNTGGRLRYKLVVNDIGGLKKVRLKTFNKGLDFMNNISNTHNWKINKTSSEFEYQLDGDVSNPMCKAELHGMIRFKSNNIDRNEIFILNVEDFSGNSLNRQINVTVKNKLQKEKVKYFFNYK